MNRLLEILLGLERGFLSREGDFSLRFHPAWPWQHYLGAAVWNVLLLGAGLALVVWIYRRESRSRAVRIGLGALRAALVLLLIGLLNRPVLTLEQSRVEPSVLPILVDDSISMRVKDVGDATSPGSRLNAAMALLAPDEKSLLADLRKTHDVRLYRFDSTAAAVDGVDSLKPEGPSTDVAGAVRQVLADLQGQRVAGVVLLTDGRDSPSRSTAESLAQIAAFGARVFPVIVGSDRPAMNLAIQNVSVQDAAFVGDFVNVRVTVRGSGLTQGQEATVRLLDKATGLPLPGFDGKAAAETVRFESDAPVDAEVQFRPTQVGTLDVAVEVQAQPGEVDDEDNSRVSQLAVLDAQINVLYVDGYPRWEYRYLKNEMIRDKTVDISCLLTSADPTFRQEGDKPITRFPESINELMEYDVVIFGDVDPRQFSDFQLELVAEFVSKLGGGFGMVAGPRHSPAAYAGTAIERLLPVRLLPPRDGDAKRAEGSREFRPVLTKAGATSSIFRFFPDRAANEKFITEQIQPLFWYSQNVAVKPGVGEIYAEHPRDSSPDGRKAPLLVLGRFGAGRTLFSGIDDSWRWRFYTGETIFDTYWVQQLRYLARGRKLGQRQATMATARPVYELGEQVRLSVRVLNPTLVPQLPEQIRVDIQEQAAGSPMLAQASLLRQEGQPDLYVCSFVADRTGAFVAKVASLAAGVDDLAVPFAVRVPRVELAEPQVDRPAMGRLATQTGGQVIELTEAAATLPKLIPSAAKVIPLESSRPVWDAPLVLAAFMLLVTAEWVFRKLLGMV